VPGPTQRDVDQAYVVDAAAAAFGADVPVVRAQPCDGGTFGSVWRVDLADGRSTALKVGATPDARLLTYEREMLAEEANYLRTVAAGAPDVPVPRLLHETADWLFMTYLPGVALPDFPTGTDTTAVREDCGAALARVHGITGNLYGYPGQRPHADTWPDAFAAMLEALLDDAVAWHVDLPIAPDELRSIVVAHHDLLATVRRPALVHFDLWDGNVLATVSDGVARLSGLVDGERYLYGDPLVDFASPALFGDVLDPPGHPFLRGYRRVRPVHVDDGVRRRVWLYQLYLYLLMIVEFPSRGLSPDGQPARWRRLGALVTGLVDNLTSRSGTIEAVDTKGVPEP